MHRLLLIFVLSVAAAPTDAQAIAELQGGLSSTFGSGAGAVLYTPDGETRFSAGTLNNHFVWSTSQRFEYHGWFVSLGDYQQSLTSGQMYLVAPVRGVALIKKQKHGELRIFAGAVGQIFSSPYFFGVTQSHFGGGFSFKRDIGHGVTLGTIQSFAPQTFAGSKTSLVDARWNHRQWFNAYGNAGLLQSNKQISGTANLVLPHIGGTINRATYIFAPVPGQQNEAVSLLPVQRVTVNNASAYSNLSIFTATAAVFDSNVSSGQTFGLGIRPASWLQVQGTSFKSDSSFNGRKEKQSGELLTITERAGLRWTFTEYLSKTGNVTTTNLGGGYTSNRLSAQVGYNLEYFPTLAQPFQRVLSVQISFRIRSARVDVGTVVLPNAKNQWSVGGDDYTTVPGLTLPALPGVTAGDARRLPATANRGKWVLRGVVVDDAGNPIDGAAIMVGKDIVYSDTTGHFQARERKKMRYPVKVLVDQFIDTAKWRVKSAPVEAGVGDAINVVLERL